MKIQKLIYRLEKRHKKKIDLTLDRTFNLLKKLGNPQDKLDNVITVVGTNAKASICQSLKSILNQAGYKCNLTLSPHLQTYKERFIYNNKEISEDELYELLSDIEKILGDDSATIFEILICAFLKHAEQFKENINIIEAGLFHQYDATNVFKKNLASIIGYINYDHISWLKDKTINGIIHEKTNKLLESNIFINMQENQDILKKIEKALINNQSQKYYFGKNFNILKSENGFIYYQDEFGELLLPEPNILGDHQLSNISTAVAASRKLFNVEDKNIKEGITKIELKGRLQEIKFGKLKSLIGPNRLVIDGGHNIGASKVIANWLKKQNEEVHMIIGMMKDKDHNGFINSFDGLAKSITLIDIPNQDACISKKDLKNKLNGINTKIILGENIYDSIKSIRKFENSLCLVVGSLYLAGEVLNLN
jgi:dihydrofolate synthase/folylpolyglutamate synthase|tara:strand:- start:1370 stop:2635 length:1266 start_codon:yes stop_codon:yes gene_type:complete